MKIKTENFNYTEATFIGIELETGDQIVIPNETTSLIVTALSTGNSYVTCFMPKETTETFLKEHDHEKVQ